MVLIRMTTNEVIRCWIRDRFDVEDLTMDLNFFAIESFDSLNFAELIVFLENHYKISLDFFELTDWKQISTITGLSNFLSKFINE